jgi:hypothetical protein
MKKKVQLLPWQKEVFEDEHRFKVICAGRRAGKSVLSRMWILNQAIKQPGLYWIVSPTYKQSKQIHWRDYQKEVPNDWVVKKNEVDLSLTLGNGSVIELKGAENPDALRGVKLRALVIDEIASIRNWDWLWQEVLRPTLTDYESPALFISTPKGFNHFFELYELGQKEGDYRSWRFPSYDNKLLPKGEIDAAKKELTEDTFHQEYLADFRTATGLAHRSWNREIHLIKPFIVPQEWNRGRGFDYGSAHPTASIRIAVDTDDNWFWERTYNQAHMIIKDHADAIKSQDYGLFVPAWGDPSGAQWFMEFAQHGLNIQPANKEIGQNARGWVEHCVEKVNERLKPIPGHIVRLPDGRVIENAPRLFVFDTPENEVGVRQIENLKWKENKSNNETLPQLDESDDPTGGHYDTTACLRYFAVSYSKPVDMSTLPDDTLIFKEGYM